MVAVPTQKGTCGIWICLRLEVNQMISVLAGLSWSSLEHIYELTSATHAETLFWSSESAEGTQTNKSACHPHKGENVDGTALLVAANQLCKEEKGLVQRLTLEGLQTKLEWVTTWHCYT